MNLWDMTPMEWCTFLNNFSVWLIAVDGLLSCCITRENWNNLFIRRHVRRYTALLIGCAIMNAGVSLKSMDWMLNISLLGWLIWMPALFFIIKLLFSKMRCSKNNFGKKLIFVISITFTAVGRILKKLYPLLILFPIVAIASLADRWWFEKK